MKKSHYTLLLLFVFWGITGQDKEVKTEQWTTFEISLTALSDYGNPYMDVAVWATFKNEAGTLIKRPAFWDGGKSWKVRFAPPDKNAGWSWETFASNEKDKGLHGLKGSLRSVPYSGRNLLIKNGLLRMSDGHRNVEHRSGKSFLVVADTPWAMPFRATIAQAKEYAMDRREKGFNAALLMSLQPDTKAEGPDQRNVELGFKRAFGDLSTGSIRVMHPEYFQYLDSIITVLIDHEIVPVYQPVFHGFGWKGLQVLGTKIAAEEYVRYCKYLLARYGSRPAFWLIAGDHDANDPGVKESGEMLEEWDAYAQPTGLHYNPCDDYIAEWAKNDPSKHCMHYNKTHQNEAWLDFQWAQTGHSGEHLYHKVDKMYDNLPTKAVANGEPTYEGMNDGKNGLGWWQGEEAWMQLMNGGTMGVVYGAACLWQWKISADEPGWQAWTDQPMSWKDALNLEGSSYVGLLGKILGGLDMTDIKKRWDLADSKPLLAKEGKLYISFLEKGGGIVIRDIPENLTYTWINPKTGNPWEKGMITSSEFNAPDKNPWVLIIQ